MKKFLKTFAYFVVAVFVADVGLVLGMALSQPKIEQANTIVILGAAIYSPSLYNRSMKGLELYEQGKAKEIILAGGRISDKDISEAGYMKKVILKNAKQVPVLKLDEESHNTYENIQNAKKLAPNAESIIIVSDAFHLARAVLLAKRAGFEDVYWVAPQQDYYKWQELTYYYAREFAAMIAYIPKFVSF